MPYRKDLKPKKPRTVFKTIARSVDYTGQGEFKDIVTKQEVIDFYPELRKMINNAPEGFLYTQLTITIDDPEKTPSNKFENEIKWVPIEIYGDHEIRLHKKKFDENGNIVVVKNPKDNEPIVFSVFDPDGDSYDKLMKLDKKILDEKKNKKNVQIEISAYKIVKVNKEGKEFTIWKASSDDIANMKIVGTFDQPKLILKDSWIKANPDEAKELGKNKPEYFAKNTQSQFKDFKTEHK
jgi:hypothetical protein